MHVENYYQIQHLSELDCLESIARYEGNNGDPNLGSIGRDLVTCAGLYGIAFSAIKAIFTEKISEEERITRLVDMALFVNTQRDEVLAKQNSSLSLVFPLDDGEPKAE